jgi:hypothetical protein
MITSPIPDHRQALTRTDIRKRINITPWITSILIPTIIRKKKHPYLHGITLIPRHRSRCWIRITEIIRIARALQRSY